MKKSFNRKHTTFSTNALSFPQCHTIGSFRTIDGCSRSIAQDIDTFNVFWSFKILLDGKKSIAEDIVYSALDMVKEKTDQEPVAVLKRALDNIRPSLEVRSRRVGGATYQVPVEVKPARANTLSLRWLTDFSRARREKTMAERLANEILDASNGLGASVKRSEDTHKMAEANKAFAHYRW